MNNYSPVPSSEIASVRRRANRIIIENPLDGPPSIIFEEEDIVTVAGKMWRLPAGNLVKPIDDMRREFPILNPETNESIIGKSITYLDGYLMVYSCYLANAIERDNS